MAAVCDSRHALAASNPLWPCEAPIDAHPALDKPLPPHPAPPSPTLTNPDMVLPNAGSLYAPSSPADSLRGPPSITYLRDITNQHAGARASMDSDRPYPAKKEKRGLMSRKLMLLRSQTASDSREDVSQMSPVRQDSPAEEASLASSPTIQDGGRLTLHSSVQDKRASIGASSFNSDEYAALPAFLHKYKKDETEDEETDTEKPGSMRMGYSCTAAGGADARRKAQDEEEEHNSAMLSQRAEQILANAKKRLNLMEGNLRGARDLVAPLTAANLKRATSLGSSAASSTANYGTKRFLMDGYTNTRLGTGRALQLQISTPSLRREYNSGHSRTLSENTLPERSHTALMRGDMFGRKGRIPVRPSNSSWTDLRGSKSHESLGSSPAQISSANGRVGRVGNSPAAMGTPNLDLEPLPEESAFQIAPLVGNRESAHFEYEHTYGLGITQSPSTTDDLKGQMSTLKDRISSLRDRAKEDSMRRQSFNNLRDASPLNNAEYQPPEMWYPGSSSTNGAEENAETTPSKLQGGLPGWPSLPLKTGSRNALAEMQQNSRPTLRERRMQSHQDGPNHQPDNNRDMPGSYNIGNNDIASDVGTGADSYQFSGSDAPTVSTPGDPSEFFPDLEVESVYEDAEHDLPGSTVPHEEREDAFDYENFFLYSAMARYQQSSSPMDGDYDSDGESISSVSTAKVPRATATEIDPYDDEFNPPPTPETPENLREIERRIAHSRKQSTDSVSTIASFATAAERHLSPTPTAHTTLLKSSSRRSSRASHFSRQSSNEPSLHRSSMSTSSIARRPPSDPLNNHRTSQPRRSQLLLSPLISPGTPLQDPTAVAVNALLNPNGRVLGLKDKALVFGVVESLRRLCEKLQEGDDEDAYELREWRKRLDGGRRELDGVVEQ